MLARDGLPRHGVLDRLQRLPRRARAAGVCAVNRQGWTEEKRSAWLYRAVARAERDPMRRALFEQLATEADKQAALWAAREPDGGASFVESFRPDLRMRLVDRLLQTLGPRALRQVLAAMKIRGMTIYAHPAPGHFRGDAENGESRHRAVAAGGNLRAAVFGVNDGLISNASLILGISVATADSAIVLLSGAAGLLAGAFSMAAGEYVSVRSQREMYEYQIGLEREELDHYPEAEAEELALIYQARGIAAAEARRMAQQVIADPEQALDTLAREELGLNPADLGNPVGAAAASFAAFAGGALIPLLPFLLVAGSPALVASTLASAVALFAVGASLSLFTGRNALASGARMLAIGICAGGVSYGVGHLLGVSLA
jgi:VIT1/CCC1 family predicted Fe2+/Mn2+ transporter